MKTCDLKEIIYLPSGIFTYASIKTCVFYFIKKKERAVINTTHQTTKIKFYDSILINAGKINEKLIKNLLVEVPIEKISSNSYSLNYTEYMKDETEEKKYEDGVIMKTIGEVFGEKTNNYIIIDDSTKYKVVGLSSKGYSKISKEIFGNELKIKRQQVCQNSQFVLSKILNGGFGFINQNTVGGIISSEYWLFNINTTVILEMYLYYIFETQILARLKNISNGVGIQRINQEKFYKLKIPIPSLERQQEIVKYLDFICEKANKTSNEKIAELKQLNEFCLSNQKIFGENVVKELGEISIINPENMKSGQYTEINYIDIASVKGGQILELQKLSNDFPSRAKRIVKKGDILYSSVRPNLKGYVYISDDIQNGIASTGFADIRVKEPNTILSKYLYYIMTSDYISDDLISKAKGAQYPAVSFDDFETIKIPLPSLERQGEIVEYCEYNDVLIEQLKKEIENNKNQAKLFLERSVKTYNSISIEEINELIDEILEEIII